MTTVLLVGTGEVGIRTARQLADTPELDRVLLAAGDPARAVALAAVMGDRVDAVAEPERIPELPDGVDAVGIATSSPAAVRWIGAARRAGVPVALVGDVDGHAVLESGSDADPTVGTLITGCGMSPGLADVLARHAADAFDEVEAVHVAGAGTAGPACAEATRTARRETPGEWRDGTWSTDRAFGPELLWFPEPVGARECRLVYRGVAETVASVPGARRVTARLAAPPATGRWRRRLGRDPLADGWGAVRVEVTGRRDGSAESIVYGMVDRTDVVAGAVLAVTAAALAGAIPAGIAAVPGSHPLGAVVSPVPFLLELARRGVQSAVFEGVAPH